MRESILTKENFAEELVKKIPVLEPVYRIEENRTNDFLATYKSASPYHIDTYAEMLTVISENHLLRYLDSIIGMDEKGSELREVFEFIEQMATSLDERVLNAFEVTIMDRYKEAEVLEYAGPETLSRIRAFKGWLY